MYVYSVSNDTEIFILQVIIFGSGFEPSSGLIQEQRYRKFIYLSASLFKGSSLSHKYIEHGTYADVKNLITKCNLHDVLFGCAETAKRYQHTTHGAVRITSYLTRKLILCKYYELKYEIMSVV